MAYDANQWAGGQTQLVDAQGRPVYPYPLVGTHYWYGAGTGSTAWPAPLAPVQVVDRIIEKPIYIERPAPSPPARIYPPSQGLTRPYHCTKPAGRHPGYVRTAA